MALTEARRRANEKYLRENYGQIALRYPKEYCAQVRAAAEEAGESIAGYIKSAIDARMEQDKEG